MNCFYMNRILWHVEVSKNTSPMLVDRTGTSRLGTTDLSTHTVYLSDALDEDMKARVLIHELGHCALLSYNLLYDIHKMVRKEYWLEAEEWLCNYLTDYGIYIFEALFEVLGPSALNAIPKQFDILLGAA